MLVVPGSDPSKEIPCVIMPLKKGALLMPNVSTAEIIPYADLILMEKTHWCVGRLQWRGLALPAVSFERLNGMTNAPIPKKPRAIIMNGILGDPLLSFYSILFEGLPRLVRLKPDDLEEEKFDNLSVGEICKVNMNGKTLIIPNIDYIEQNILKYHSDLS